MLKSFRSIIRFSFSELSGNFKPKGLYFDYQATTPVDYRVLDAMLPYMTQNFGNPHSKTQ
jgi:selenocysteine lyase/cysteine desulfurase